MVDSTAREPNGADFDGLRGKLKKLLVYRLVLAVFFLLTTIAVQNGTRAELPLFHPLYIFSCILFLFTIFGALSLKGVRRLERFAFVQLFFDLGAVTVLVFMTGGIESSFSSLYMLVIFSAALLLHRRASLLTASACSLVYGLLLDLQYFGWISPLHLAEGGVDAKDSGTCFFKILINTAGYFLAGLVAGYLARELERSRLRARQSERDLSTLVTLHTSIVRSMSSGLLTVDLNGRIEFSNTAAQAMLGVKPGEIDGRLLHEVFTDIDFLELRSGGAARGGPAPETRRESSYSHPAGMKTLVGYSASALIDENGAAFGWVVIFTDLTKRKALEEHIQRMERFALAGRLSAEIAHEIKNPLAAMSGAVQMLHGETALSPVNLKLVGILQREIARVNGLVSEFLWLTKDSPRSERTEEVAVRPVIEGIVTLLRADKKAASSHTIKTDFRANPAIAMDPDQLHRVLWNLLVNGLEAMPEGGELSIGVDLETAPRHAENPVRIDIADTGCGIPDPALAKIFDPFFTTKANGTGLGLSIVYQLVQKASGKVEVHRSATGSGTTFSLFFPQSSSFSLAK